MNEPHIDEMFNHLKRRLLNWESMTVVEHCNVRQHINAIAQGEPEYDVITMPYTGVIQKTKRKTNDY